MLPSRIHGRLIDANSRLAEHEREIREFLGLRVQPRLALLDESSATYLTADDRDALERDGRRHRKIQA